MKVSEMWLREWVNPPMSGEDLIRLLTMSGLEVESRSPVAAPFEQVVVGHVLEVSRHPEADRLSLCKVDSGPGGVLPIVCGARNVRQGLKVALAMEGASLPNGLVIRQAKVRGELSVGMLCSETELGLASQSEGILELDADAPVGTNLREYLMLDDSVIEISITPNRADCLGVAGLARETAALTGLPVQAPAITPCPPETDGIREVTLAAPDACPLYCGRVLRGINPHATTPLWMRERLRRSGVRPLHPVVDVTNYVMLEWGHPMHAFDLAAVDGGIIVRRAQPGEAVVLLDGQTVVPGSDVTVIADAGKILALAGVMGGKDSAVQAGTTDVFLESAWFSPDAVSGVARKFNLSSESALRYERGVDTGIQEAVLERATALLLEIAGGTPGAIIRKQVASEMPRSTPIAFRPETVARLTGLAVPESTMQAQLRSLGMTVDSHESPWRVTVPSHRFDMHQEVDVVEEIARLTGYDNLLQDEYASDDLPVGHIASGEALTARIGDFLAVRGYHETISYSFVDGQFQEALFPEAQALTLLNPIASDLSHMRVSLLPGLLASMLHNLNRQESLVRIFETGTVFVGEGEQMTEYLRVGGLLTGTCFGLDWTEKARTADFFDVKGDIEALAAHMGLQDVRFVAEAHDALHPGQSAAVWIQGERAGWIGTLHPRLQDTLDCNTDVIVFELSVPVLGKAAPAVYKTVSRFPKIRRDLSLLTRREVSAQQIEEVVRTHCPAMLLRGLRVFDVYEGAGIGEGMKSVSISLILQDPEKTLEESGISTIISAIIKALEDNLFITLRE